MAMFIHVHHFYWENGLFLWQCSFMFTMFIGKTHYKWSCSPFRLGKLTISMVIFNGYVSHYQRLPSFLSDTDNGFPFRWFSSGAQQTWSPSEESPQLSYGVASLEVGPSEIMMDRNISNCSTCISLYIQMYMLYTTVYEYVCVHIDICVA